DIFPGEFFALLGPSGCGKTTLLRLLAGFETSSEGRVLLDGRNLAGVPPHRRPVNMMFQNYALFPHLTVERNVAFGLEQEGLHRGRLMQVGTPAELYEQPRSRFVTDFIGDVNLIAGRVLASGPDGATVAVPGGTRLVVARAQHCAAGDAVWVAVRPEKVRISSSRPAVPENSIAGTLADIAYLGDVSIYKVRPEDGTVLR